MDKKIIDLQVKELSKEQYTKEHVLNELEHVMEHIPTKKEKVNVRSNKLDKNFKKLYIAYCELLQQQGLDVICTNKKAKLCHLLKKQGEVNYTYYPERLFKFINSGDKPKSCRQKLKDKYDRFMNLHDVTNLNDYQRGYYNCLQQLMIAFKYLNEHDVYPMGDVNSDKLGWKYDEEFWNNFILKEYKGEK